MYTNDITSTYNSGIVINDVADHFGTFCLFHGKMKKSIPAKQKKRSFNSNNIETFQTKLRETDFSEIVNIECPNIAYNTFLRLYLIAFNDSFPLRDVNVRSKYVRREPWFTPDLLASSLTKAKLLSQKLRKPTTENVKHYKDHLIVFNRLKRNTKKSYFKTALEENKRNSKKCWSILKPAIGKINDKSSYPQTFMINNSKISDKGEISEGFNNFFSSIGLQTSHNVPSSKKCFSSYMPKPSNRSFFLGPVAPSDVSSFALKIQSKISSGHDEISSKLMKNSIDIILEPLTHIINQSLNTGTVPSEMKIAKVIPIHKSSDPSILKKIQACESLTCLFQTFRKNCV